jgi:hypothetical protein
MRPNTSALCLLILHVMCSLRTGGITGRVLALFFVARFKRASLLIFSLVAVLTCSIFIYLTYLIDSKIDFDFSSVC